MNIQGKTIWQQACGDDDRNYSKICLKWDVILNGPGYAGPYPECAPILKEHNRSARKVTDIKRFATKMKSGDLVVLRIGTKKILAVGEIVGDYEWNDCFSDVDGWDLQHVRRVRWLWDGTNQPKHFDTYTIKQGDTTQVLNSKDVEDWITTMNINPVILNRPLQELPKPGKKIDQEEIAEYLFDKGVSSQSIQTLMNEFDELERIARWYMNQSENPSEFETISYLAIPIL
jgi:predicted Mrr-cat superfamily restriction endonuclease